MVLLGVGVMISLIYLYFFKQGFSPYFAQDNSSFCGTVLPIAVYLAPRSPAREMPTASLSPMVVVPPQFLDGWTHGPV